MIIIKNSRIVDITRVTIGEIEELVRHAVSRCSLGFGMLAEAGAEVFSGEGDRLRVAFSKEYSIPSVRCPFS